MLSLTGLRGGGESSLQVAFAFDPCCFLDFTLLLGCSNTFTGSAWFDFSMEAAEQKKRFYTIRPVIWGWLVVWFDWGLKGGGLFFSFRTLSIPRFFDHGAALFPLFLCLPLSCLSVLSPSASSSSSPSSLPLWSVKRRAGVAVAVGRWHGEGSTEGKEGVLGVLSPRAWRGSERCRFLLFCCPFVACGTGWFGVGKGGCWEGELWS